ncbi:DUF6230 family protein [Neobacillus dielmonensis]|uniref:DUF6230 family protein n=1 Tax=Neobacillus dielmonensis TaxID=1347369 RepID=UPI0005A9D78F|nr:DUF6230 family protein [Neobacillus dielmonensis]
MTAEAIIVGGKTVKKKLMLAILGGFLFLGALLGTFGLTGVAYAVPLSGVGEFTVSFDKMVGSGFHLYGGIAEGGSNEQNPVAVNEIDDATITNLKITKEFPLLNLKAVIEAGEPVEITGLVQKATLINGDASFESLTMQEHYVGDIKNPLEAAAKEFTQDAGTITITNGDLKTLYLFQQTVSLPGMKVYFEHIK